VAPEARSDPLTVAKYRVRDRFLPCVSDPDPVNAEHGIYDDMAEAKQRARDVAVDRGFDPAGLSWCGDSRTCLMLLSGTDYTRIEIDVEG
jgi:hypothetical protein